MAALRLLLEVCILSSACSGLLLEGDASKQLTPSDGFTVSVDGVSQFVYQATADGLGLGSKSGINASFVFVQLTGQLARRVEVTPANPFSSVALRPRGSQALAAVGRSVSLYVNKPGKFMLEFNGSYDFATLAMGLMIFAHEREDAAIGESVLHFGPGLHELPYDEKFGGRLLRLASNSIVHLEAGAVVLGYIRGDGLHNVTIRGAGILAASFWPGDPVPLDQAQGCCCQYYGPIALQISRSSNVTLRGITIVHSTSWNVKLISSTNIQVQGVNIIAWQCMNDGIDIVSSQNIAVEGCFIRSNDDAVALKGTDPTMETRDVIVKDSILWGQTFGNCMEIGFELWNAGVSNVTFQNNTCFHSARAAMSIHNAGHATVRGIEYRDIVVEGVRPKWLNVDEDQGLQLVDMTILAGSYSGPDLSRRGHITDVVFTDITYHSNGIQYLFSRLLGNSSTHGISYVEFDRFHIGSSTVSALSDLNATSAFLSNVSFKSEALTFV